MLLIRSYAGDCWGYNVQRKLDCCLLQAELVEHVRLGLDVILFLVCLVLMLLIVIVVLRRTWGRDYLQME